MAQLLGITGMWHHTWVVWEIQCLVKSMGFQPRRWCCTPLMPVLRRQQQAELWVHGYRGLQSEFQDSQGYTKKSCLENQNPNQTKQTKRSLELSWEKKNTEISINSTKCRLPHATETAKEPYKKKLVNRGRCSQVNGWPGLLRGRTQ